MKNGKCLAEVECKSAPTSTPPPTTPPKALLLESRFLEGGVRKYTLVPRSALVI